MQEIFARNARMQEIFACGIQNLENLLVESGVLGFGIRNTAQGIWNPANFGIRNPISIDKDWNPVTGIWDPRYGIQNPESKTVLDSLTWGKYFLQFLWLWQAC